MSHITGIALFNQVSGEVLKLARYEDQQLLERLQHEVRTKGTENGAWVIVEEEASLGGEKAWLSAIAIKKLSVHLIKKNPSAYLKQVVENSREFWVHSATYVFSASKTYEWMERTSFYGPLKESTNAQYWQRPGRILFLLAVMSLATIILTLSPVLAADQRAYVAAIAGTIIICMFTHVAVNVSDLARYRMPVQTLYLAYAAFVFLMSGKLLSTELGKLVACVRKRAF